jgi:hypothetical protein
VTTHDFDGNGVVEIADALLVLRGIIGLGEQQVIGVTKGGDAMALSDELIERILRERYEWWENDGEIQKSLLNLLKQSFTHLGTYNDNVVFIVRGFGNESLWRKEVAGYEFVSFYGSRVEVWNNGTFYELTEWIMPPLGDFTPDGELLGRVWFGRFAEVYADYPEGTIMPGVYESGLLTQEDIGEIHGRFTQWMREYFPNNFKNY